MIVKNIFGRLYSFCPERFSGALVTRNARHCSCSLQTRHAATAPRSPITMDVLEHRNRETT